MTDKKDDKDKVFSHQQEKPPELWEIMASKIDVGGRPVTLTPVQLWEGANEYFKWAQASTLTEEKVFGTGLRTTIEHVRPFTRQGLSTFLGITTRTLDGYAHRAEYQFVHSAIKQIMFEQKLSGAVAGLMNASIIARELGLIDRTAQVVDISDMTDEQIEQRTAELMAKAKGAGHSDVVH